VNLIRSKKWIDLIHRALSAHWIDLIHQGPRAHWIESIHPKAILRGTQ
jgi:hypothetical protein